MEIYNDNLSAMAHELTTDGEVKPTKVQLLSNLAYDKLTRYLNELERKKMIIQSPLSITNFYKITIELPVLSMKWV